MKSTPKFILLVNDSRFSWELAKPLLNRFSTQIDSIVFSSAKNNSGKVWSIFKRTHFRYFFYRCFIELLAKLPLIGKKLTIRNFCKKNSIKHFFSSDINTDKRIVADSGTVVILFNFDQIIKGNFLKKFDNNVYNIHASKLPHDKGISPALWSFARGDDEIWSSIYRVDTGLDSGALIRQFPIKVLAKDSAFSLYSRVCQISGNFLSEIADEINDLELQPQVIVNDCHTWSWPDKTHRQMMKKSGRCFFSFRDALCLFKNLK